MFLMRRLLPLSYYLTKKLSQPKSCIPPLISKHAPLCVLDKGLKTAAISAGLTVI
jgi:hypothetical protein